MFKYGKIETPAYTLGKNGLSPHGENFLDFLREYWEHVNEKELAIIIGVCKKIEGDGYPERKTGEDYVTHLYEVTMLYIALHGKGICTKRIITCLLHDSIEDIETDTFDSLKKLYGEEIAFYIQILSKTSKNILKDRSKEYNSRFSSLLNLRKYIQEAARTYKYNLPKGGKKIAEMIAGIKISDRVHNLSTMPTKYFSYEEIEKKIKETEDFILPLCIEIHGEDGKLTYELQRVLQFAKQRLIKAKTKNKVNKRLELT